MQWIFWARMCSPLVFLAVMGCNGDGEEGLPAACRAPASAVERALRAAPDPVELDGTPLSGCLVKSSTPAEIQEVGATYLSVASGLAGAGGSPEGGRAFRLGYLIGAARRGSERTQGIHAELVRRLEQEAAPLAGRSEAYARGEQAGMRSG